MRFLVVILFICATQVRAGDSLNILVYHHVATDTPASTSVSPEQFAQHLDALIAGPFEVVNLAWALETIQAGQPLPDHAVAITFDDGYANIFDNALPLLYARNLPFTVFVTTDPIDRHFGDMMDWDMLRTLKTQGGTVANHSVDHDYFIRHASLDGEWLAKTYQNIETAQTRLEAELGDVPRWFAYPYGEYNNRLKALLQKNGWIAFGQQSGGVAQFSDFQALPRFSAGGSYADWASLSVKLLSKPLPAAYTELPDPIPLLNPPELRVRLLEPLPGDQLLNCFVNGTWQAAKTLNARNFSLQPRLPLPPGRSRYNCTYGLPDGSHYWFSHQWLLPTDAMRE